MHMRNDVGGGALIISLVSLVDVVLSAEAHDHVWSDVFLLVAHPRDLYK